MNFNTIKTFFNDKVKPFTNKFNPRLNELKIFQKAYYWFILPLVIVFIACVCGTAYEFSNKDFISVGIDFRGGTMLTVEDTGLSDDEAQDIVAKALADSGISDETYQNSGTGSVFVRYANRVNNEDKSVEDMAKVNEQVIEQIVNDVNAKTGNTNFTKSKASAESIGSSASNDLIKKALLSVGIALILMLVYIVIRFNFWSAIAAICGQVHDIIMMFALIIIFRVQINSSAIACFITIIAYGINNVIVVFDRIRENMKAEKVANGGAITKINVTSMVNVSVGEVVKRTLLSSLTTLLTIGVLAIYGAIENAQTLVEFALPIIFGLIAGVYSSIVISPTIWGLIMQARQDGASKSKKKKVKRAR